MLRHRSGVLFQQIVIKFTTQTKAQTPSLKVSLINIPFKSTYIMKNLFPYIFLFFLFTKASAQDSASVKQKENLSFPELLVFSNEFENYFSSKNKIEKIVSDKTFLEGPVWVAALKGLLFTDMN